MYLCVRCLIIVFKNEPQLSVDHSSVSFTPIKGLADHGYSASMDTVFSRIGYTISVRQYLNYDIWCVSMSHCTVSDELPLTVLTFDTCLNWMDATYPSILYMHELDTPYLWMLCIDIPTTLFHVPLYLTSCLWFWHLSFDVRAFLSARRLVRTLLIDEHENSNWDFGVLFFRNKPCRDRFYIFFCLAWSEFIE